MCCHQLAVSFYILLSVSADLHRTYCDMELTAFDAVNSKGICTVNLRICNCNKV